MLHNREGIYLSDCIQDRYIIQSQIGSGAFSKVYSAIHKYKNTIVVIKSDIPDYVLSKALLKNEIRIYLLLLKYKIQDIATIKTYGIHNGCNFIVMNKLNISLDEYLYKRQDKTKTIQFYKKLFNIIYTLISTLHDHGIIYRDVKPDNFMLCNSNKLHLIDLGLCSLFDENRISKNIIGTPRYSSFNTHKQSYVYQYSDDIISIYYMMFEFISNKLPWTNVNSRCDQSYHSIMYDIKRYYDLHSFYKFHPKYEILKYFIDKYNKYLSSLHL